jgi:hypothetical protein
LFKGPLLADKGAPPVNPNDSDSIYFMMRACLFSLMMLSWAAAVPMALGEPVAAADTIATKLGPIMAEKKTNDRLTKLTELGVNLSLAEIPQALTISHDFKQWRERAVFQTAVIQRWAELSPVDAFAHITNLPESHLKIVVIKTATIKLATWNPERAAATVTGIAPGPSRNEAMRITGGVWAKTDAKKALAWADSLPEGGAKNSVLQSILFVWVQIDPVAACTRIQELPPADTTKETLLANVASGWGALDPQAALKWASSLPDGLERYSGIKNILSSWADQDPVAAAEYARQLSPKVMCQEAVMSVLTQWVTQDPSQAAQWLMKNTDAQIQQVGMAQLMNFWAAEAPREAEQSLEKLPHEPLRDLSVQNYVNAVATLAPDLGAKQALTITEPGLRDQNVEICVRHWLQMDPASAQQWLKEAKLSQAVKDKCLLPSPSSSL